MRSRFMSLAIAVMLAIVSAACARTDAGITTAVKSRLAADEQVKAYQIDVDTRDKVVTLTGSVETASAKSRAVELASNTEGVLRVVDNLTVSVATGPALPSVPDAARAAYTDPALTTAVKAKLIADPMVSALRIDVDTADGVVTLNGEVRTQAERDQALRIARETGGVKSVTDRLTVKP